MSEEAKDGAAVRFPPPFVPVIGLVVGMALHHTVVAFGVPLPGGLRWALAALLVAAGIALLAAAFGLFQQTGQDPKPWVTTPEIISTGIYAHTRNPMYVSMGLLQAGLGLVFGSVWPALLVPVTWLVIYQIAIRHEEAYLEGKFGAAYTDYKKSVRRWL